MALIVTGARKGLGRYCTEAFLKEGYSVIGCSRGDSDLVHNNYTHYECDVGNEKSVIKLVREVGKQGIKIEALINNAGTASMNHILSTTTQRSIDLLTTNFVGTLNFTREVSKHMMLRKIKGKIINFSSVAAPLGLEGEAVYASSKSAVEKLTQITAKELAHLGVTVNCVGPTPIATDLIGGIPKNKIDELINQQAIKRLGKPEDVLNVIMFFLSDKSNFITGQTVYLGGVNG